MEGGLDRREPDPRPSPKKDRHSKIVREPFLGELRHALIHLVPSLAGHHHQVPLPHPIAALILPVGNREQKAENRKISPDHRPTSLPGEQASHRHKSEANSLPAQIFMSTLKT